MSEPPEPEPRPAEPGPEHGADPMPGHDDGGRRYPSTIGGMFYLVVLAVSCIGLMVVTTGSWRAGIRWIAGALLFAALVRLVLPARDAGMLAVRKRWWDCLLLGGVGLTLLFLASSIPDQPAF